MLEYFIENHLIFENQSAGFRTCDSRINKVMSITHDINKSFNMSLEVRGVFHTKSVR